MNLNAAPWLALLFFFGVVLPTNAAGIDEIPDATIYEGMKVELIASRIPCRDWIGLRDRNDKLLRKLQPWVIEIARTFSDVMTFHQWPNEPGSHVTAWDVPDGTISDWIVLSCMRHPSYTVGYVSYLFAQAVLEHRYHMVPKPPPPGHPLLPPETYSFDPPQ